MKLESWLIEYDPDTLPDEITFRTNIKCNSKDNPYEIAMKIKEMTTDNITVENWKIESDYNCPEESMLHVYFRCGDTYNPYEFIMKIKELINESRIH